MGLIIKHVFRNKLVAFKASVLLDMEGVTHKMLGRAIVIKESSNAVTNLLYDFGVHTENELTEFDLNVFN